MIAGTDRAFDGSGQASVCPIAGKDEIAPLGPPRPDVCASCAGVAAKVARRSRTICQGGSDTDSPVTRATSPQIAAPALPAARRSAGHRR